MANKGSNVDPDSQQIDNYSMQELASKISKISNVLDVQEIASISVNKEYIQKYYQVNKIPYSIFHNSSDQVHMGISRDGVYKKDDLLAGAKFIAKYISETEAGDVLELATGRGANALHLARQFPKTKFYGIDISDAQLSLAKKKAEKVSNYFPRKGDYHDLTDFDNDKFDVIFVVEAFCHSTEKEKVFSEAKRVLKKDGYFIVFDGYLNKTEGELSDTEKTARVIVEKGMALEYFEPYKSFLEKAQKYFKVTYEEDLSTFVIPTMERFEKLGNKFFKYPNLARLVVRILPRELVNNAAVGYLLPTAMRSGLYSYVVTVFRK